MMKLRAHSQERARMQARVLFSGRHTHFFEKNPTLARLASFASRFCPMLDLRLLNNNKTISRAFGWITWLRCTNTILAPGLTHEQALICYFFSVRCSEEEHISMSL